MNLGNVANSLVLKETAGHLTWEGSRNAILGLGILSALTGTLTITGVNDSGGAPVAWTLGPGSVGAFAPPGAGLANKLSYTLSTGTDAGKAFIAWRVL